MFSHRAAASASIYTLSLHDALPICTLEDPVIRRIAERHGNSPAQMMLRWHLDQGRQVIPTSAHAGRITENLDLFDVAPERGRSEEHTSELQSRGHVVCRLLLEQQNST